MANLSDFDEYLSRLKEESERGAIPNSQIPLERFVSVAHNILQRLDEINPLPNSKKELYELSQKFVLQNRFVFLFTRVIWAHPDAAVCKDVVNFRKKAIELLNNVSVIRTRLRECWERDHLRADNSTNNSLTYSPEQTASYPQIDDPLTELPRSKQTVKGVSIGYPSIAPVSDIIERYDSTASTSSSIHIPFDLPNTFQTIAKPNTNRGIETCGVLLGKLIKSDIYRITTMVIPPQTGTRDTCEALPGAEEKILYYALTNNLVCLGWIHTHPTQSCFLSSIDMHTTLPYQQMLDSAIAIVVAPTDRDLPIGVWRLTMYGMSKLKGCKLSGFHNHEGKDAYSELVNDVSWDTTTSVTLVDHR